MSPAPKLKWGRPKNVLTRKMGDALVLALREHDGDLTLGTVHGNTANALERLGLIESAGPGYGWKRTWRLTERGVDAAKWEVYCRWARVVSVMPKEIPSLGRS